MNDFMTDTDTEMDKGWMTFTDEEWEDLSKNWETVEDQNGISGTEEEQENFRQEERERLMEQKNMGPLLATITMEPGSETERLYELAGGDGMGPNDDIPMDFGREEYQENGPDAYADTPHIYKLNWELPE